MRVGAGPYVLSEEDVADEVVRRVVGEAVRGADAARLEEIVHETVYHEQRRLLANERDPRTDADRAFVATLRHDLAWARRDARACQRLVARAVERYTREIAGHFDARVYKLATRVLPRGLGALLGGGHGTFDLDVDIDARVHIEGEVPMLRALAARGTVVLVPTHVSNLDSPLLGWAIYRMGLSPFAYAAGLNLFSNAAMGFFMRHLGAYTVDRKKSDPLYRATLKEYTTILLERGQHVLFFPGGTRSRSGALETHLKQGLLGMVPVAYRRALLRDPQTKIFVVPCTLNYPLVLEASSLAHDYLRAEGGPHYLDLAGEFERPRRFVDFVRGLRALDLQITLRVGRAFDPVGHEVDDDGVSRDRRGRPVDPAGYFTRGGELAEDPERDVEYTHLLAARVLEGYRKGLVVLPSTVVAFALFERIRRKIAQPDLFRLLRVIGPEHGVPVGELLADVQRIKDALMRLEAHGRVHVSTALEHASPEAALEHALAMFSTYHHTGVIERRGHELRAGDAALLFFYKNRLEGFGLEAEVGAS